LIPSIINGFLGGLVGARLSSNSESLSRRIVGQILSLNQIFVLPLMSIVPALLYIKMRQLGGEQLKLALEQLDEGEGERSNWQQRMRTRLSLATPVSQKTTTTGG
jgi:hypothetical protein